MVSHVVVWDIMAFNGIIHALARPLLAPQQPVSWWGVGRTIGRTARGEGTALA